MKLDIDLSQLGISFSEKQTEFLRCMVPNLALIGGFGSGKTLPLCVKTVLLSALNGRGYSGVLVSPTFDMYQRVLLPTLRDDVLGKLGDPENGASLWDLCEFSPSMRRIKFPWGFDLLFGSADRPMRLRGLNLAFAGVDEATTIRDFPELAVSLTSRLRKARKDPKTGKQMSQFYVVGTPEGIDHVYQRFSIAPTNRDRIEQWRKTHKTIRITTLENPGAPREFIEELLNTLSEDQIKAYIYGEHIDVGKGLCYYNYTDDDNIRPEAVYDSTEPLHLSFDFNINPMSCSVHQIYGGSFLMTIDEISLKNSNTPEVCREIIKRYGPEGRAHKGDVYIYGDASAVVGVSNYDEIDEWVRQAFRGNIIRKVPRRNPRHLSRLKAANGLLTNSRGRVRWIINPKCRQLITDLKLQRMVDGMSKDKSQNHPEGGTLGHMSDTADYLIDQVFPYKKPNIAAIKTGMDKWVKDGD